MQAQQQADPDDVMVEVSPPPESQSRYVPSLRDFESLGFELHSVDEESAQKIHSDIVSTLNREKGRSPVHEMIYNTILTCC